jgi:hypothetical protein
MACHSQMRKSLFSLNAQVLHIVYNDIMLKNKKRIGFSDFAKLKRKIMIFSGVVFLLIGFFIFVIFRNRGEVSSINFSSELEDRINFLVAGYPIEEMAPYISKKDRTAAAFLIAISKKESDWGKHSPEKDGKTCYNYWGYRGTYNQTDSGYSCFDSPEQAVEEVGGRITDLIQKKVDTPGKMAVAWKCGWDCSAHSFWSVKKWEWDVGYYFKKIYR